MINYYNRYSQWFERLRFEIEDEYNRDQEAKRLASRDCRRERDFDKFIHDCFTDEQLKEIDPVFIDFLRVGFGFFDYEFHVFKEKCCSNRN